MSSGLSVSVVVPAYNASEHLQRTLVSVLRQSYRPDQIVVVDDGSTDRTAQIVRDLAVSDDRIQLISQKNAGVAAARNAGIEASTGDLISFLDADDLWHPDKLSFQVAKFREDSSGTPTPGAVYSLCRHIDAHDRIADTWNWEYPLAEGHVFARLLSYNFVRNGSNLTCRRDVALSVGGFRSLFKDEGIYGTEDWDFSLRVAARYPFGMVPKYHIGYRLLPGSMSANRRRMATGRMRTLGHHLAANPNLQDRVRRLALAGAYAEIASAESASGHWASATNAAARSVLLDPGRLFSPMALQERWKSRITPKAAGRGAPDFFALDPDDPAGAIARGTVSHRATLLARYERQKPLEG